jgi:2-dehydropantoate 2-reductase
MPFVQALIGQDGRLNATIGAAGQKSRLEQQRWVEMFIAAGLPVVLDPEMALWLRCHAPLCVAFESASVAAVRRGGGASWAETMVLARGVHESFALIQRLGYRIYPSGKSWLHRSPAWVVAGMLWFLTRIPSFRELLATGANECRALVDVMVAAAARAHSPDSVAAIQAMKPFEEQSATSMQAAHIRG